MNLLREGSKPRSSISKRKAKQFGRSQLWGFTSTIEEEDKESDEEDQLRGMTSGFKRIRTELDAVAEQNSEMINIPYLAPNPHAKLISATLPSMNASLNLTGIAPEASAVEDTMTSILALASGMADDDNEEPNVIGNEESNALGNEEL